MNHSTNRPDDDLFTRLGNGLTRWVLGWGFLTFHATIFTISMIAMVLWNFYDSPNDIWVDEVFRRWGAVLTFHAIVVAAGLTAWRLIRAEQRALDVFVHCLAVDCGLRGRAMPVGADEVPHRMIETVPAL